jgi:hypothetical protein
VVVNLGVRGFIYGDRVSVPAACSEDTTQYNLPRPRRSEFFTLGILENLLISNVLQSSPAPPLTQGKAPLHKVYERSLKEASENL